MTFKNTVTSVAIALSSLGIYQGKNIERVVHTAVPKIEQSAKFQEIVCDTFSRAISDEAKVVNFNQLLKQYGKPVSNYVVVDKKNCLAKVYSPDGKLLYKTEVALGRDIGDMRGGGYLVPGAELRAYTTPGEFEVRHVGSRPGSKSEKLYDKRVMPLNGDHTQKAYQRSQVLALHRVPATPMGRLREGVINNGTLKDNRVSFGCVNFLKESFDKMMQYIKGVGTKVYILPEESGNSLHLEKLKNGNYKFFQTKYRHESLEPKKKVSIRPSTQNTDTTAAETVKQIPIPQIKPVDINFAPENIATPEIKMDSIM